LLPLGASHKISVQSNVHDHDLLAARVYSLDNPKIFKAVNSYLRDLLSSKPEEKEAAKKKLQDWSNYLYHLQMAIIQLRGVESNTIVYRGQRISPPDIDKWKVGDEFVWPAFTSCSISETEAIKFSYGNVMFRVIVDSSHGCMLGPYSYYPSEKELLLPAFCRYKVNSLTSSASVRHIITLVCLGVDETLCPRPALPALNIEKMCEEAWKGNLAYFKSNPSFVEHIHDVNRRGQTMLYCAAHEGHTEMVKYFLNFGADVNCFGNRSTPLHAASYYARPDCVRVLLENGANPKVINLHHKTPVQEAKPNCTPVFAQFGLI